MDEFEPNCINKTQCFERRRRRRSKHYVLLIDYQLPPSQNDSGEELLTVETLKDRRTHTKLKDLGFNLEWVTPKLMMTLTWLGANNEEERNEGGRAGAARQR